MIRQLRDRARSADRWLQGRLQRSFERRLGIATSGRSDPEGLAGRGAGHIWYVCSPTRTLRTALKRLRPGPQDVFADIGSGKGQAVIIAAQLPFGRVIGVELSDQLTDVARSNVERARPHLRCEDVELVTADAPEWPIPEDLSVVYLYSPFVGTLFERVVERIFASYDAHPRRLRIVYAYPWEHNWLVGTGRVEVVDVGTLKWPTRPGWWDTDQVIVTYEVRPAEGSLEASPVPRGGFRWARAMERWAGPNEQRFMIYPPDGGPPLRSETTRSGQ